MASPGLAEPSNNQVANRLIRMADPSNPPSGMTSALVYFRLFQGSTCGMRTKKAVASVRLHLVSSGAETSATVMDGRMKIADEDETIKEASATDHIHQAEAQSKCQSRQ
jgi:hypothetical protein